MSTPAKFVAGLLIAAAFLLVVEGLLRVTLGPPVPELAATMPDGSQELIRHTESGIAPLYQHTRKQPAVSATRPGTTPRIVWLGGSSIHGGSRDITREEEAPGRAGALLGVESLNFAGIGIDTVAIGAILENVLTLRPDVLVLYTGHNELGNAVFTGRYGDARTAQIATLRARFGASRLYQTLEMVIRGRETLTLPSERNERQYTVGEATRTEIHWRYEERLRHIVSVASSSGVKVVLATLMSNPVAPSMEFSCPEAMKRAGFRGVRPEAMPVDQLTDANIAAAEAMAPGCRDLQWLRARRAGDVATLDELRDTDPLPVRADRTLNGIIRRVAAETGATLVDVEASARMAGAGLEPSAWFLDPMHLTVDGHDALARMVAQGVAPLLSLKAPALASAPTEERDLAGCCTEGCRAQPDFLPDLGFGGPPGP